MRVRVVTVLVALAALAVAASSASAQTSANLVAPRCSTIAPVAEKTAYPVANIPAGSALVVNRWTCSAKGGGADVTLRMCSGTVCGPMFSWFSQPGGCGEGQPLEQTPAVMVAGPAVLELEVRVKSANTKALAVCLD